MAGDAATRLSHAKRQVPASVPCRRPINERRIQPVPGKFVVEKGSTGKFRFNLLSTNGRVVATSEAYNSKASAMGGVRSIKSLAADAAIEDQTTKEWAVAEAARKAAAPVKKTAPKVAKKASAAVNRT